MQKSGLSAPTRDHSATVWYPNAKELIRNGMILVGRNLTHVFNVVKCRLVYIFLRITLRTRKLLTTERGCHRRNVNDGRWQKAAGYFSALVTLVTIDGSIASRHGYHRDVTLWDINGFRGTQSIRQCMVPIQEWVKKICAMKLSLRNPLRVHVCLWHPHDESHL